MFSSTLRLTGDRFVAALACYLHLQFLDLLPPSNLHPQSPSTCTVNFRVMQGTAKVLTLPDCILGPQLIPAHGEHGLDPFPLTELAFRPCQASAKLTLIWG